MIISHKHKFIFLKTEKTASTSIEIALSKICGEDDIITKITSQDEKIRSNLGYRGPQNFFIPFKYYSKMDWLYLFLKRKRKEYFNHMSAKELLKNFPKEIWDDYYKFTFERNPYDKTISWYYYMGDTKKSIKDFILSGKAGSVKGFELYTLGGVPIVDDIFDYHKIDESLKIVSEKINCNDVVELPQKRAKGNVRKDKRDYSEVLSEEERQLISKIFAREIAYFDYTF